MNENELIESLKRNTELIVRHMGIGTNLDSLPSWQKFQNAKRTLYGGNFVQRIWAQHIRPHLFPKLDQELFWAYHKTELEFKNEFLNTILSSAPCSE